MCFTHRRDQPYWSLGFLESYVGGEFVGDIVGDSRCTLQRYNHVVLLFIDHMAILDPCMVMYSAAFICLNICFYIHHHL